MVVTGGATREIDRKRVRVFLAPMSVKLLRAQRELSDLPETLERLGIATLGELQALPAQGLPYWSACWCVGAAGGD